MDVASNYVAKHDKLAKFMEMTVETASPDYARVTMPLNDKHKNGMNVGHGGAIFALADVAFGAAANAGRKTGVVSLTASIEFLQAAKSGPLVGEARLVRAGNHILSYNVQIFDGDGNLVARSIASGYATSLRLPE